MTELREQHFESARPASFESGGHRYELNPATGQYVRVDGAGLALDHIPPGAEAIEYGGTGRRAVAGSGDEPVSPKPVPKPSSTFNKIVWVVPTAALVAEVATTFMAMNDLLPGSALEMLAGSTVPGLEIIIPASMTALGILGVILNSNSTEASSEQIEKKMNLAPAVMAMAAGVLSSMPELVTAVFAVMAGLPDMALGNAIGSNITNSLAVGGVANLSLFAGALFGGVALKSGMDAMQNKSSKNNLWIDQMFMLVATAGIVGSFMLGEISNMMAYAGLGLAFAYLLKTAFFSGKADNDPDAGNEAESSTSLGQDWQSFFASLFGLIGSAAITVAGAAALAGTFGVPEAIIGGTIIAFGTSLPEISLAGQKAAKGNFEGALSVILSSNIFNIAMIASATVLLSHFLMPGIEGALPVSEAYTPYEGIGGPLFFGGLIAATLGTVFSKPISNALDGDRFKGGSLATGLLQIGGFAAVMGSFAYAGGFPFENIPWFGEGVEDAANLISDLTPEIS